MQTIFSRSPWERDARPIRALGQSYSWNGWGDQSGHDFTTNPYGSMSPEQRLLKNAEESMKAAPPLTPEERLLRNNGLNLAPSGEIASTPECFTCVNGSDVKSGVDGRTAAQLRSQGYRCRKDECAQQQPGYGYGNTPFNFADWSRLTSSAPATSSVSYGGYGGGNYGSMMAGQPIRVVNR